MLLAWRDLNPQPFCYKLSALQLWYNRWLVISSKGLDNFKIIVINLAGPLKSSQYDCTSKVLKSLFVQFEKGEEVSLTVRLSGPK